MPVAPNFEDSLKNGLWAYFDFNNGNFSDLSSKSHNMVGVNNIKFGVDMWGNENNCLEFDGYNDYAVIDSGKKFPEGNFTISFLVMSKTNFGRIFQKANFNDAKGASISFGFDHNSNNPNKFVFNISKDDNVCNVFTDISNSSPLYISKQIYPYSWYQVTAEHVNGMEKVYINGKLVGAQPTPNATFKNCTSAPFYLGMWWLQDIQAFAGKVDDLRIYTRALSEDEIKYIYDRLP